MGTAKVVCHQIESVIDRNGTMQPYQPRNQNKPGTAQSFRYDAKNFRENISSQLEKIEKNKSITLEAVFKAEEHTPSPSAS
jgi:hypothetical protein